MSLKSRGRLSGNFPVSHHEKPCTEESCRKFLCVWSHLAECRYAMTVIHSIHAGYFIEAILFNLKFKPCFRGHDSRLQPIIFSKGSFVDSIPVMWKFGNDFICSRCGKNYVMGWEFFFSQLDAPLTPKRRIAPNKNAFIEFVWILFFYAHADFPVCNNSAIWRWRCVLIKVRNGTAIF